MLKNKTTTYLLLILATIIWGLIFYKIYSNFGDKNRIENNLPRPVTKVENIQTDSIFTISLDYPDPFLKGQSLLTVANEKNTTIVPVVNWPIIEYRGLLTNNIKNESTGLLKIQNSNLLVKQGKVYSALKVLTLQRDSILLEYQKVSRWLRIIKN